MLLSRTDAGWAFVNAKPIVSPPFVSYFTYGRWPGTLISVRAGDQRESPSAWLEKVGL